MTCNIVKLGNYDEAKTEIEKIEDAALKSLALAELEVSKGKPMVNFFNVHIKRMEIGNWSQCEVQISGRYVEPKETKTETPK